MVKYTARTVPALRTARTVPASRTLRSVRTGKISKPKTVFEHGNSNLDQFHRMAEKSATPFWWITGHGQMTENSPMQSPTRVPPATYVVFLSAPGFILPSSRIMTSVGMIHRLRTNPVTMRRFVLGKIHPGRATNAQFWKSSWKRHIYGPGDTMPRHILNLYDGNSPSMDALMGVHRVGGTTTDHNTTKTVSQIVRDHGVGIYFVMTCRGTAGQHPAALARNLQTSELPGSRHGHPQFWRPATNVTGLVNRVAAQNILRARAQKRLRTVRRKLPKTMHPAVRLVRKIGRLFVKTRPRPS